jgi:poly(3-hydroxybutyrate) depolymerase
MRVNLEINRLPVRQSAHRIFLAAALLATCLVAGADAAEPREETGFGSNPGNLRMFSYVPADLAPRDPLVVVLHGCKQKSGDVCA